MMWYSHARSTAIVSRLFGYLSLLIVCLTFIASTAVFAQTPGTPVLAVSPSSLSFTGAAGGASPTSKVIQVSNNGGGNLFWYATEAAGWLTASASGGGKGVFAVYCNTTGLAAGTHTTNITVRIDGYPSQTKTIPVTLTLSGGSATSPTIGFSPTSLSFSGTVGGTSPTNAISISNTGGGTLSWTVSDNTGWLSVGPASGTNAGTVTASANLSGLAAGTYNGTITVSAAGATNSPKTIPVSLTVSSTTTKSATLTWTANAETDLAGYKIYRTTSPGAYGAPIATVGKTTSYSVAGLSTNTTYYFVITAYDTSGNESSYSIERSKTVY